MHDQPHNANITIRFEQVCDQSEDYTRRLVGFVKIEYLVPLITYADLHANPRESKVGAVTEGIIKSIEKTPELFPFKTKGILIAQSTPLVPVIKSKERYTLNIDHPDDGILDGGHNVLAIAIYILNKATNNHKDIKKIKYWADLKENWQKYETEIESVKSELNTLVPVEVLSPKTQDSVDQFKDAILGISAARNNNAQLKSATKADHAGHFEEIKKRINKDLKNKIEWKTNAEGGKPVKVDKLIALAWIALRQKHLIDLPKGVERVHERDTYNDKGKCMKSFVALMEHTDVSKQHAGKYELHNRTIGSVFDLLKDLPKLYDEIYKRFPNAYNKAGGSFGRIDKVKKGNKQTPFYRTEVEYEIPEGFIMPLVYGLSELMDVKAADGCQKVVWKVDPFEFIDKHLNEIVKGYKKTIDDHKWDAPKVGRAASTYANIANQFKICLLQQQNRALDPVG